MATADSGYHGKGAPGLRLTPGADIMDAKHDHVCGGCKAKVLLGRVRDQYGTIKWRNFELPAIERGVHRYYRRHFCPR